MIFGMDEDGPASACAHVGCDVPETRPIALLDECMGGVEPQPICVIFTYPMHRVFNHEASDHWSKRTIEVHATTPGGDMPIGEVLLVEFRQVGAFRAQMVVDHVEHDGQAQRVGAIDE